MVVDSFKAGLAFFAGCALLAFSESATADSFSRFDDGTSDRRLLYLDPHGAAPKLSTLGLGLEYRIEHGQTTALRIEQFVLEGQRAIIRDFYNYKLFGRLESYMLAFDWHPFRGTFRTSAGIIVNRLDAGAAGNTSGNVVLDAKLSQQDVIDFLARPDVQRLLEQHSDLLAQYNIDINSPVPDFETLSGSASLNITGVVAASAKVKWNRIAPYVGLGWTNSAGRRSGFTYSIDIGAMYVGRPSVELSLNGPIADELNRYYRNELQGYVESEQQRLEEKYFTHRVLPVVSIGLWYRF